MTSIIFSRLYEGVRIAGTDALVTRLNEGTSSDVRRYWPPYSSLAAVSFPILTIQ